MDHVVAPLKSAFIFSRSLTLPHYVYSENETSPTARGLGTMSDASSSLPRHPSTLASPHGPPRPLQKLASTSAAPSRNSSIPAAGSHAPESSRKRKASPGSSNKKKRKPSPSINTTSDDDAGSASNRQGRDSKRTRVHFSCVECYRRKQRCSRGEPCRASNPSSLLSQR